MFIESIEEKLSAIRLAQDCMNSVMSVNPNADFTETFITLNQIKMDLIDARDEQEEML